MERRLQSFVFRKGLARSMKQARQFITHSHLMVKDRIVTAPSHIITKSEEELIRFSPRSSLLNPEHPERAAVQAKKEEKTAKEGKETKEAVKQHENMKATQKIKSSEA
ncbi:hypothetical protein HY497_00105 [Candidatus Woesearchaeota archaeon]|nr:hypothetical protein [Candidatus Woesearchaeota archaeon]